jgi:hypothetical protein
VATTCEPWPVDWTCDVSSYSVSGLAAAQAAASDALWALSGRQYGACTITTRPCRRDIWTDVSGLVPWTGSGSGWNPSLTNGYWTNICGHRTSCGCTSVEEVTLDPSPVSDVIEVLLDGWVIDPAAYRVDDHRLLVRIDGGSWPACQDIAAAPYEPGAFAVTYTFGLEVPPLGRRAVGELACEFLRSSTGDGECRLPERVQSFTRQGVTVQMPDPEALLTGGMTGLYWVDLWLNSVNPAGLQNRATILSPDIHRPRRTTWPP